MAATDESMTQYWAAVLRAGDVIHVGGARLEAQAVIIAEHSNTVTVFGLLDERPCVWVLETDDVVTFDREGGLE